MRFRLCAFACAPLLPQGGIVYKYNLQSGEPRGAFPSCLSKKRGNHRKIEAGDVRQVRKKGGSLDKKALTKKQF